MLEEKDLSQEGQKGELVKRLKEAVVNEHLSEDSSEESVHDDFTEVNYRETEPNIDVVTLDSPSILVSSRSR